MAPSPTSAAKAKAKVKVKKEKVFHPQSRKAGQLERAQLRKAKLISLARQKSKKESARIDKFVFFYHAISPEAPCMTLPELHEIVRDVWLKRHDMELEAESSSRRKGRPKSPRQMILEEMILRETEEYRTGFEVPDLTHALTVTLFRRWGQTGIGYLDLLRFIRISSETPEHYVVSRPGKHESLTRIRDVEMEHQPDEPLLVGNTLNELPLKFSSTMQTMDDGPPTCTVTDQPAA